MSDEMSPEDTVDAWWDPELRFRIWDSLIASSRRRLRLDDALLFLLFGTAGIAAIVLFGELLSMMATS